MRIEGWYLGMLVATALPEITDIGDAELFVAIVVTMLAVTLFDVGRARYAAYRDAVAHRIALTQAYELD